MRDFFRAFCESWLTFMSGIASVGFWLVSAVAEGLNYPISVRVGFIAAAAISTFIASYRVWLHATKTAAERITTLAAKVTELQEQLSKKNAAQLKEEAEKRATAYVRLNKLGQDLGMLMEARKQTHPKVGGRYELEPNQQKHAQETKKQLAQWLASAVAEAKEVSLEKFLPASEDVDAAPATTHGDVERIAQRLRDGIEVILRKLGAAP